MKSSFFIRGEGIIPSARFRVRASGRIVSVLNQRPIPYKKNIPRPFRVGLLILLIITGVTVFSAAQVPGAESFRQEGVASWYGKEFEGRPTASGEIFNPGLFTAAHPTLPFGTVLTVTNKHNMRQVTVRINDRGPFVAARIIDLSRAAAEAVDMIITGTAPVIVESARNTTLGPVLASAGAIPIPPAISQPAPVPENVTPPAPVPGSAPLFFPAPPAEIKGLLPPAGSVKLYRLQVGAFSLPRNAVDAFEKLKKAGLEPNYEQYGEYYRVVLAGLKAADIPAVAQTLGNNGFREAIIREEN